MNGGSAFDDRAFRRGTAVLGRVPARWTRHVQVRRSRGDNQRIGRRGTETQRRGEETRQTGRGTTKDTKARELKRIFSSSGPFVSFAINLPLSSPRLSVFVPLRPSWLSNPSRLYAGRVRRGAHGRGRPCHVCGHFSGFKSVIENARMGKVIAPRANRLEKAVGRARPITAGWREPDFQSRRHGPGGGMRRFPRFYRPIRRGAGAEHPLIKGGDVMATTREKDGDGVRRNFCTRFRTRGRWRAACKDSGTARIAASALTLRGAWPDDPSSHVVVVGRFASRPGIASWAWMDPSPPGPSAAKP